MMSDFGQFAIKDKIGLRPILFLTFGTRNVWCVGIKMDRNKMDG